MTAAYAVLNDSTPLAKLLSKHPDYRKVFEEDGVGLYLRIQTAP